MMLTAQLDKLPDGFLTSWLIALGGVALVLQLVLNLTDRFRAKKVGEMMIGPDPLRTQAVKEMASREEIEEMSGRIETDIADVKATAASTVTKQHLEIVAIHSRINKVAEGMEAIRGQLAEIGMNQRLLMEKLLK